MIVSISSSVKMCRGGAARAAVHEEVFQADQAIQMEPELRVADRARLSQLAPAEAHLGALDRLILRARGHETVRRSPREDTARRELLPLKVRGNRVGKGKSQDGPIHKRNNFTEEPFYRQMNC